MLAYSENLHQMQKIGEKNDNFLIQSGFSISFMSYIQLNNNFVRLLFSYDHQCDFTNLFVIGLLSNDKA